MQLHWYENTQEITFVGPTDLPDFKLVSWKVARNSVTYPNGIWDQLKVTLDVQKRLMTNFS